MEVTDELKAKAFLPYWGRTFINGMGNTSVLSLQDINDISLGKIKATLILKPLYEISDEDAAEICRRIHMDESHSRFTLSAAIRVGKRFVEDMISMQPKDVTEPYLSILVSQFLQSEGYDVPNFYINGGLLEKYKLAIYKNKTYSDENK